MMQSPYQSANGGSTFRGDQLSKDEPVKETDVDTYAAPTWKFGPVDDQSLSC